MSYVLGQIRMYCKCWESICRYPFIQRYAKQNGITDVSTVIEAYESNKPIRYYLFLEKTELLNPLREMNHIDVYAYSVCWKDRLICNQDPDMQLECICTIEHNVKQVAPFCYVNPKFCHHSESMAYIYLNNDYKHPIVICSCKFDSSIAEGDIIIKAISEEVLFFFWTIIE